MKLTVDALCGSTMALDLHYLSGEDGVSVDSRQPFAYKRYLNIPEDADYCTIWFGLNDSRNTILGMIDDKTNETFYGAWNVVLSWILENRPYTKVGVIITNGGARSEWLQATRDCARKWGVPYLDLVADDKIPGTFGRDAHMELCAEAMELRKKAFYVGENNWHPNHEAHLYHSYIIEAFLRSI